MSGRLLGGTLVFALFVGLAGVARTAQAATMYYSSEPAFIAAVGSSPLGQENFAALPPGSYCHSGACADSGGLSITASGASVSVAAGGPVGGGIDVMAGGSSLAGVFLGPQIYYYGFSYAITGYPVDDAFTSSSTGTTSLSLPDNGFFGLVSSTPLTEPTFNVGALSDCPNVPGDPCATYVSDVLFASGPGISPMNPLYPTHSAPPGGPIPTPGGGSTTCSILSVACYEWAIAVGVAWLDPTSANTYTYQTLDGSLLTSIAGFPTGFSSPFDVSSGGVDYGLFGPGQTLVFPGGGVSSFTISGINPSVDGSSPTAFPLEVSLDTAGAQVEATAFDQSSATPEPSSFLLCVSGLGLGAFGYLFRARRIAVTG